MNYKAILHTQESQYCYALDMKTIFLMLRVSAEDEFDSVCAVYGNKYDFRIEQKTAKMRKSYSDGDFDYYTVEIRPDDVRFVYVFTLEYKNKKYYFSSDGISQTYDFSLAYFNSFQLPYINSADVMPVVPWFENAVVYEIFPERFCRGDFEKDDKYINLKWGELPTPKSFAGGDLQGIADKLDYIKGLGVTAIYLTPVFKSASNHKYDISDYFDIDPQFGGKAAFKRLVDGAHERGMKIILDAVFNHCSDKMQEFRDVLARGSASPYFNWFIVHGDKIEGNNYEYFGVCPYMPKLNTSDEGLRNFLIKVGLYWIEEFGIDGWRLDVADEVSHDFWRHFRDAVKKVKPECIIIGENWHDSYSFLRGDQFDSVMNYALTKACTDYFIDGTLDALGFAQRLNAIYVRNTRQVNAMMLNLLDSHDTHRFYTLAKKNRDKLICALAVIYMHTGSPCVYYGTEVPLEGGYDPDCRRTMDWNAEGKPENLSTILRALSDIRKNDEIAKGEISFSAADGLFMLERRGKNIIRLTINNTNNAIKPKPFGKELLSHNYSLGKLGGNGFIIEIKEGK